MTTCSYADCIHGGLLVLLYGWLPQRRHKARWRDQGVGIPGWLPQGRQGERDMGTMNTSIDLSGKTKLSKIFSAGPQLPSSENGPFEEWTALKFIIHIKGIIKAKDSVRFNHSSDPKLQHTCPNYLRHWNFVSVGISKCSRSIISMEQKLTNAAQISIMVPKQQSRVVMYVDRIVWRLLSNKKTPALMLKLDVEKAFDRVSWEFLLAVLSAKGFGRRWRDCWPRHQLGSW